MKKIVFILVAVMALAGSAFAQSFQTYPASTVQLNTEQPSVVYTVQLDSIEVPSTFMEGQTPSYFMKQAAQARTISAVAGIGGGLLALGASQLCSEDITFAVSIGIVAGVTAAASYIVSLVYDNKAADAASKVKFVGNGVSISF